MKKKITLCLLLAVALLSCKKNDPGSGGSGTWNFTFKFEENPLTVSVGPETKSFFLRAYLEEYIETGWTMYPVYVDTELTTAVYGVHYEVPRVMEYRFGRNNLIGNLIISVKPQNITEEVKIVFVSEYLHETSNPTVFDRVTVLLVPEN